MGAALLAGGMNRRQKNNHGNKEANTDREAGAVAESVTGA